MDFALPKKFRAIQIYRIYFHRTCIWSFKENKQSKFEKESWEEWVSLASAEAIPGSVSFLKFADQNGIQIFYISNRAESQMLATVGNLIACGFPQANKDHLLLRNKISSKTERRSNIAETHEIIMLCGDNLSDFSGIFEKKTAVKRHQLVDSLQTSFGSQFIILPNPMYGDWESAIYGNQNLAEPEKMELRRASLTPYKHQEKPWVSAI